MSDCCYFRNISEIVYQRDAMNSLSHSLTESMSSKPETGNLSNAFGVSQTGKSFTCVSSISVPKSPRLIPDRQNGNYFFCFVLLISLVFVNTFCLN